MILEDLYLFLIIYLISSIIIYFIYKHDLGPFNIIFNVIGLIGVIIHELSHLLLCIIAKVPVKKVEIKYSLKGVINPNGSVTIKTPEKVSFLQGLIISVAPLLFCTWLIFIALDIIFIPNINILLKFIAGIFCISLLIGARPSSQDFLQIIIAFKNDKAYSLYQLFLLVFSIILTTYISLFYHYRILGFLSYVFIAITYFILKYCLKGISSLYFLLRNKKTRKNFNIKLYTMKKIHLPESSKIGNKDGQW